MSTTPAKSPLRLLSLCTGIGGIDYVWSHLLGQAIVGQVENNRYRLAVLARHWPDVPKYPDLKELTDDDPFAEADLVAGGIPCQPFSLSGQRRGTADDRHLWPYAFALLARRRPTWVLIENVAGFISLALDLVQTDLESAGYQTQAYVLPACAVGAPHIRERCFVLAYHPDIGERSRRPQPAGQQWTPNLDRSSSSDVAHAQHRGCERRMLDAHQPGATVLRGSAVAWSEPQPGMDRMLHGLSDWLDGTQWPAAPGQPQAEWEPARTVTEAVPHRRARLEALGDAIVPQQIYPLLAAIVALEHGEVCL